MSEREPIMEFEEDGLWGEAFAFADIPHHWHDGDHIALVDRSDILEAIEESADFVDVDSFEGGPSMSGDYFKVYSSEPESFRKKLTKKLLLLLEANVLQEATEELLSEFEDFSFESVWVRFDEVPFEDLTEDWLKTQFPALSGPARKREIEDPSGKVAKQWAEEWASNQRHVGNTDLGAGWTIVEVERRGVRGFAIILWSGHSWEGIEPWVEGVFLCKSEANSYLDDHGVFV